ncbi:dicarboxylate/amino acid:cation symporter [Actinotignum urinale]|uniref:dicarboxylate/amino acid:cation symporter n=1 Tax=Actinotignum urinale TaxID=190146 RepID=UPI0003B5E911|nr:dicarboxylate/amino acid:cation symporter [Actinotignum urinale]MDY5129689.1 dicarboxylate/amino acid:cation symporter [Actinotignum urinale]MDY5151659.1 dicarboxylate/amino acid:cation symporter [Actinotignum urinale]MDY5160940.1 dicarboxylate/amino acid:cation symporter [Actinotignum urinale]WIK59334.1 dicarboxylate/amino acid:cation symporter [Actinotignum urinale]
MSNVHMQASPWTRLKRSLLFWVLLAIIFGAALGQFLPSWAIVPFATFNDIFGKYLGFSVPLIIVGLVAPAIYELGSSGGKWLLSTVAIAYGSNLVAGFGTWGLATLIYPSLLAGQKVPDLAKPEDAVASIMDKGFKLPPVFDVMTALIVAFMIGIGIAKIQGKTLGKAVSDFRDIITLVIAKTIVPLLPLHIFGIFMNMSKSGQFVTVIVAMSKIILFSFILTVVLLLIQYSLAGAISKKNPFKALWGMRDAYATALGTASSAATIPVTARCTRNNGVSRGVADFVIPLCATIHLAGSSIKITAFALALQHMMGIHPDPMHMVGFIMMLSVILVAAPGVPGGAITAAQALLQGMLAFTDPMYAIMVAMYVAVDSFGTATNVTGDGAIAIVIDHFARGSLVQDSDALKETVENINSARQ